MKILKGILCACAVFSSLAAAHSQVLAVERAAFGLPTGQVPAPNTPGGGVVVGKFVYVTDAVWGFRHYQPVDPNNADPINTGTLIFDNANDSMSLGGTSLCVLFCHAGQVAYDGNQTVYITAYDHAKGQPGSLDMPGVWRVTADPVQGFLEPSALLAPRFGLAGNQPTSIALGPDGNLYVGFLKNGNVVRITNPTLDPSSPTQIVQSVGTSPNGRPIRALAVVGADLYLASTGGLSVIKNAVSSACQGGCNGVVVNDGFNGANHVGIASDGINRLYIAIDGQGVWRYTISTGAMQLVSIGGTDGNTGAFLSYAFVGGNSNMVMLDRLGNLWIGDDASDGLTNFSGRIWYISAAALGSIP
jgi:hypothetical protein